MERVPALDDALDEGVALGHRRLVAATTAAVVGGELEAAGGVEEQRARLRRSDADRLGRTRDRQPPLPDQLVADQPGDQRHDQEEEDPAERLEADLGMAADV